MAESKKKGLGKGLSALLDDDFDEESEKAGQTLPIGKIEPRKNQPRKQFDAEALDSLADSIRTHGLIQPITVRAGEEGQYEIIAGERRWRACRIAGLTEVPVRIIEADDKTVAELALVENLQREDLNAIEEAQGYRTLMDEYGLTQEQTAEAVGKSRPAVANMLRLLSLSPYVLKLVQEGSLSAGHARALLQIHDETKQAKAAETVLGEQLSVRQTEQMVTLMENPPEKKPKKADPAEDPEADPVKVDYAALAAKELEQLLGRHVKITDRPKVGKIELEYYGSDDREALLEALKTLKK